MVTAEKMSALGFDVVARRLDLVETYNGAAHRRDPPAPMRPHETPR
jgi:hypothetical protein